MAKKANKKVAKTKKPAKKASPSKSRWFELADGSSEKFWSIELKGNSHTAKYGRIGADGQTTTKNFADNAKAKASFEKLIEQKVNKGYVEVKAGAPKRQSTRPVSRTKWIEQYLRCTWLPKVRKGDGEITDSKFSGVPALMGNESWPLCGGCETPMQLMLQLNLDELPEGFDIKLGSGLLQFFYCVGIDSDYGNVCCPVGDDYRPFSNGQLVRIIQPRKIGDVELPEDFTPFPAQRIVGWTQKKDYPHGVEYDGLDFEETLPGDFTWEDSLEAEQSLGKRYKCQPGDKLSGWPYFVQGREYPSCTECGGEMQFVFQIDGGWKCHLPHSFGDNGCGHIMQCPKHKKILAFSWACC